MQYQLPFFHETNPETCFDLFFSRRFFENKGNSPNDSEGAVSDGPVGFRIRRIHRIHCRMVKRRLGRDDGVLGRGGDVGKPSHLLRRPRPHECLQHSRADQNSKSESFPEIPCHCHKILVIMANILY